MTRTICSIWSTYYRPFQGLFNGHRVLFVLPYVIQVPENGQLLIDFTGPSDPSDFVKIYVRSIDSRRGVSYLEQTCFVHRRSKVESLIEFFENCTTNGNLHRQQRPTQARQVQVEYEEPLHLVSLIRLVDLVKKKVEFWKTWQETDIANEAVLVIHRPTGHSSARAA